MKKGILYLFAVWVLINPGHGPLQLWKFPQAEGWSCGGPAPNYGDYRKRTFILTCDSTKNVVEIPQYKVVKIGFGMKESWDEDYHVYHNPACLRQDGTPVHSDDVEVYINQDHVRTMRSSEGKTSMPPAHIVHYDDLKGVWY